MNKANLLLMAVTVTTCVNVHSAAFADTRSTSKAGIILELPKDSIGTIERIIDGMDYSGEHSPGTTFAELKGKIALSPDTILGITIRDSLSDPMPVLARFPADQVQSLTLSGLAEFNERTIKGIMRFRKLKRLQLDRSELDDKGLAVLATLPDLESLVVSHTQIKGTTFSSLCGAKKLTRLDLGSNEIKGEALKSLGCMKQLRSLSIGRCRVRNPYLEFLTELPDLQRLEIYDNDLLSDTCMKYVSRLHKLTDIKLDGTNISPKGFMMLKGAPLRFAKTSPNFFSPAERAEAKRLFPRAIIKENNKQSKNYSIFKELFEDKK